MKNLYILSLCILVFGCSAAAQAPAAGGPSASEKYFTNTELVDQTGRKLRFYADILKGRTVVINVFHTTCKSSVPPMNRNLDKIADAFPGIMGKDLLLISITVDPTVDTATVVSAYAKGQTAGPGRLFLTGAKENVDAVLKKLGQYVEDKEQHTNIFLIGNDRTGLWKKAFGLAKPDDLIAVVKSVVEDKGKP